MSPDSPGDMPGSVLQHLGSDRRKTAKLLRGPRRLKRLSPHVEGGIHTHPRGAASTIEKSFEVKCLTRCPPQIF